MANLRLTWSQDEYRGLFGSVDYRESRKEAERRERRKPKEQHPLVLARGGRHETNPGIC